MTDKPKVTRSGFTDEMMPLADELGAALSPQPQPVAAKLTDARIDEIIVERLGLDADEYAMADFARAIEAEVLSAPAVETVEVMEATVRQWMGDHDVVLKTAAYKALLALFPASPVEQAATQAETPKGWPPVCTRCHAVGNFECTVCGEDLVVASAPTAPTGAPDPRYRDDNWWQGWNAAVRAQVAAEQAAPKAEPIAAWQERQQTRFGEGWTSWYDTTAIVTAGKTEAFEISNSGIRYQFRPLYATPSTDSGRATGDADIDWKAEYEGAQEVLTAISTAMSQSGCWPLGTPLVDAVRSIATGAESTPPTVVEPTAKPITGLTEEEIDARPPLYRVHRDRSYDQRAKAIIAFNTCTGDLDDKLDAAWLATLGLAVEGGE